MMRNRASRRLAAIVAMDVAGYSRLMEQDESGTLARLKACRRDVIEPTVARHGGRIVKTTGDGFLIEMGSAVDGVTCAVEIQRLLQARPARPAGENLRFRIGVNVGDVMIDDDDIYGDGINVAARLESLAEPGGVLISRNVRDHIRGKLPYDFQDRGEFQVKNITRAVRAFLLSPEAIAATPLPDAAAPPPRPRRRLLAAALLAVAVAAVLAGAALFHAPREAASTASPRSASPAMSIVVLPFLNASGDADKDAFADAVTERLITDLSRIAGSFVIASNTTFAYRGQDLDPRRAATELGVRYVLAGSVRRIDDAVWVSATLIDGETGAQLWGERYERTRGDLDGFQEEITGRVARTLNLKLNDVISRRTLLRAPSELDADDFAARAWAEIWNKPQTKETNLAGLAFAEQALRLDPKNASALSTASYAEARAASSRWSDDPPASLARAVRLAEAAVAEDPNDADALYVLSYALRLSGDRLRAEEANRLCVAHNPNHAPGYGGLGILALQDGRLDEARDHFREALALSPRDPLRAVWFSFLGIIELISDRFEDAVEIANRGLAANPDLVHNSLTLAAALQQLGREDEAEAVLRGLRDPAGATITVALRRIFQATSARGEPMRRKYMRYLSEAGVPD